MTMLVMLGAIVATFVIGGIVGYAVGRESWAEAWDQKLPMDDCDCASCEADRQFDDGWDREQAMINEEWRGSFRGDEGGRD